MVLRCPHGDRISCQQVTFSPSDGPGQPVDTRKIKQGTTTMLNYLIVSELCLLLLLHIVRKVWQMVLEMHSAADSFDKARDLAARGQRATNDSPRNSTRTRWLESSPPKYCHVW